MRRVDGAKMDTGALKGFCQGRVDQLDRLMGSVAGFKQLPDSFKPKMTMYEAEFAKQAFLALIKGNVKRANEMFACLPIAIGKVNLFVSDFIVHMGWGWMQEEFKTPDGTVTMPVVAIRNVYVDDPWAWREIKSVYATLDIPKDEKPMHWLLEHGYQIKKDNVGMVRCIGWNELSVNYDDPGDMRTYKDLKITGRHTCDAVFCSSEPWHRPRCQSCDEALKAFRDVGGRRPNAKTKVEHDLNVMLESLK